ncbi:MAG: autoinducer binding domain-containing protein [Oricola sp.]
MAQNVAPAQGIQQSELTVRISECKTNYDILRLAREFAQAHGFDYFSICRIPEPGERKIASSFIVSNWPPDLITGYDESGFLSKSPVFKTLRVSTKPVLWEARTADSKSPDYPGPDYYDLFARFGINMATIIPVQQASGQRGAVALSGNRGLPCERELMEISYFSNLFFSQIAEIGNTELEQERILSARECECLQWTASGKTSQEIAAILDLSEHTVNHYLSAACQKLGAVNRAHAVAKAIRSGLLD